jgi:hypothetical protein
VVKGPNVPDGVDRPWVLFVLRNGAGLDRAIDLSHVFDGDRHVKVRWVIQPGSEYAQDIASQLVALDHRTITWDEAMKRRFALIIAPHAHADLRRLDGFLIVLPHGAGHRKMIVGGGPPSGFARSQLMHDGVVIPDIIVLSHRDQLRQLRAECPEAVRQRRYRLICDPAPDLLRDNHRRSRWFRIALGVESWQRQIVLSSTWSHGLLDSDERLIKRMLAELPLDRYRLVLVCHPNIQDSVGWEGIKRQYRYEIDSGLIIVRSSDWKSAVLGADLVIGDHGSATFYAAHEGVPVLLASTGVGDLDPGNPAASLERVARRLDFTRPFVEQIENAIKSHDPAAVQAHTSLTLGGGGHALAELRRLFYQALRWPEPDGRAISHRIPEPVPMAHRAPTSYLCHVDVLGSHRPRFGIERYPAAMADYARDVRDDEPVLVHNEHEMDPRVREVAAIDVDTGPQSAAAALSDIARKTIFRTRTSPHNPRLFAAARTDGGIVAGYHPDQLFAVRRVGRKAGNGTPELLAVTLHAWLARDPEVPKGRVVVDIDIGGGPMTVSISAVRDKPD